MIGRAAVIPYLREVPVWTYGPIYNTFGEYVRDGWSPQVFGEWKVEREPGEADEVFEQRVAVFAQSKAP